MSASALRVLHQALALGQLAPFRSPGSFLTAPVHTTCATPRLGLVILREHGPDPTISKNSDQTGQQAQDRPEPVFHFHHFAREPKQGKQRRIGFSEHCDCELAMYRCPGGKMSHFNK